MTKSPKTSGKCTTCKNSKKLSVTREEHEGSVHLEMGKGSRKETGVD